MERLQHRTITADNDYGFGMIERNPVGQTTIDGCDLLRALGVRDDQGQLFEIRHRAIPV